MKFIAVSFSWRITYNNKTGFSQIKKISFSKEVQEFIDKYGFKIINGWFWLKPFNILNYWPLAKANGNEKHEYAITKYGHKINFEETPEIFNIFNEYF